MISHPELEKKQKELESLCNVKYAWLKSSLLKERQAILLRGRARWLESINGSHWPVQIDLTNDQIMLLRPEWYNGEPSNSNPNVVAKYERDILDYFKTHKELSNSKAYKLVGRHFRYVKKLLDSLEERGLLTSRTVSYKVYSLPKE